MQYYNYLLSGLCLFLSPFSSFPNEFFLFCFVLFLSVIPRKTSHFPELEKEKWVKVEPKWVQVVKCKTLNTSFLKNEVLMLC